MSDLNAGEQEFIQGYISLQTEMLTQEQNSIQENAVRMAGLIKAFIKSAKVTVQENIPVATTGSATAQTGKTTAKATGELS
ncbi:MAG: hypothetical protein WCJ72_06475 [Chryseobacterium sp.]|jgi:hypothetical protein